MSPENHVKVFKNDRNQAIRIPREFEFSGEEAILRKEAITRENPATSQIFDEKTGFAKLKSAGATVAHTMQDCEV